MGYSSSSPIARIDAHPALFIEVRRAECDACEKNVSCCEANCEVYKNALAVHEELEIDPCGNCFSYLRECKGFADVDPEKAVKGYNSNFPSPEKIIETCPF